MLIVGVGEIGQKFARIISDDPHLGYRIVGFLDDTPNPDLGGSHLGPLSKLETVLSTMTVDEIIVALPNSALPQISHVMAVCDNHTARVRIIPDYFKFISNRFSVSIFGNFPLISIRANPLEEIHWRLFKRLFDLAFSLLLLLFVFPWLWPLIAMAIKFSSPGPILFRQERWGRNSKRIRCFKFRTMVKESQDVGENGNYLQASKGDPRITRVGRFLRRTSLDELPQFINVIQGSMSVVGPRPHPTPLNLEAMNAIGQYTLRHLVKPGITGWAQINGFRGETKNLELMKKRVEYDLWYIENWTFWLDIQIVFLTAWRMLKGDIQAF
jgi:putative colanic acid biosynthesis UDP-glucose lipid carrier transferase